MLSDAVAPFDGFLESVLGQAQKERSVVRDIDYRELRDDQRAAYAAAYALIRVGNAIARYSRRLEIAYPDYSWVFWVDLRNNLAHQLSVLQVDSVWESISAHLPELIRAITGEATAP